MFVGGSDALKATTYFTIPHGYAQHRNFTEDLPKIKHKLAYKGAIRLVWVCWLVFFFIWREESALSLNVTGKAKRFRALTECGEANHRNFCEDIRGRKLAREAGSLIDDQGVTGALKEDKAVAGKRDEFALLFAAVEAGDGSVLEMLFRRFAFEGTISCQRAQSWPCWGRRSGQRQRQSSDGTSSPLRFDRPLLLWSSSKLPPCSWAELRKISAIAVPEPLLYRSWLIFKNRLNPNLEWFW